VKELAGIYDSDDLAVATEKLRRLVEQLVGPEEAEAVAGHIAILLGFETKATTPDRDTLFQSVRIFIEAGARDEATAFVFEDIHWGDPALLDLIELLAARLHDLPVLLLTLARPELLDTRPAWGGGLVAYNALPLEPLAGSEAAQLALHLLGADTKANQVAQAAEGNPLFIEQLAAVMNESGAGAETLPTTIRGLVAARLDALPAEERDVILDASIVGRIFWRGALERIARDPASLSGALAALERRDLIRRDTVSRIEGDQQWSFKHVLIRDVAYDLQPRARRREGHRHSAEFIEQSTPEVGEAGAALARHWRGAGELEHAATHFVAAAEEAERGWAKEYAVTLYKDSHVVVDDDVTVLPDDLREFALDELTRAAADRRHLRLVDLEAADYEVTRHARESSCPRRRGEGHGAFPDRRPCPGGSSRRASGAPRACTAPCGTGSTGSRCARSRCGSGCGSRRRATR
jgi:hypothetical protein